MTTMNITLTQVDEQMKRLQEIKAFLEGIKLPTMNHLVSSEDSEMRMEESKPELKLVIHEYWNK